MSSMRRITYQKRLILDCLALCNGEHVTAEQLLERMKRCGTPVGKSTIYRYLKQLEDEALVKRFPMSDGSDCYQFIGGQQDCNEHYHLKCEGCGEVLHFSSDIMGELFADLREQYGFCVDERKAVLFGTCSRCSKKTEDQ